MLRPTAAAAALLLGASLLTPAQASAFCGFYVSGADAKLFNNATQVVLMRDGTRTVLSMQNNYQGPPENFAMVVPVPVVLHKENVKTLPRDVFDRIDQLSAPRLVEYWEQDPCPAVDDGVRLDAVAAKSEAMAAPPMAAAPGGGMVRIEAQFAVGEYEIVILSADDSMALDTWLRQQKYKIPEGAEPYLRPYVQGGMKFFVAKVDIEKVKFEKGQATLSPLRFHYDDDRFSLPVRLGLLNSSGTQDLIINILARQDRYEAANYPNAPIPTNLELSEQGKEQFGAFYAALFDRTLEKNPRAVVTEYAWMAGSCDPCPVPTLQPADLTLLGGDVIGPPPDPKLKDEPWRNTGGLQPWQVTLTRLHARYSKEALGDDIVFRKAPPIRGGNENWGGKNEQTSIPMSPGSQSTFQGRYILRHPWTGPITCTDPRFGVWGGPPGGHQPPTKAARDLAFAPRGGASFASWLVEDIPSLDVKGGPRPEVKRVFSVPVTSYVRSGRHAVLVGFFLGLTALGALALRARRMP